MNEKVLVMSNIKKSFPGVQALKGVSIELRKGEILGLVGENGAGKSTLLKILTGVLHPDEGHIILRGKEVKIRNPQHAFSLGIAYVPQETNLYPNLSVAENMFLGVVTKGGWKRIKYNDLYIKAREYLSILGVEDLDPSLKVGQLSASMQQIVMIARALAARAEIFVLDEPTSALTPFEVNRLFSILRKLRDSGYSVIFVSHRLEEVLEVSDRITVLRDGLKVAEYDLKESKVTIDDVVKAMIAREIKEFYPKEPVPIGDVILEVKNLSGPNISNINFHLRSGEILGVFGLLGSGIIELGLLLGGVIPATSGEIFVKGKKIHISKPVDALHNGLVILPEDRRKQGLIPLLSVRDNITISMLLDLRGIRMGLISPIDKVRESDVVNKLINSINIIPRDPMRPVMYLSGGNQQKVLVARAFTLNPDIIILCEPTKGIDVGAKVEIRKLMVKLAKEGKGIVLISADLYEVVGMSDRILVMHKGKIAGEFTGPEITHEKIFKKAVTG